MCLHGDMPEMRTIGRLTPFYLYLRLPISHQECHYRVGDSVNTQTPSLSPPTFVVSRLKENYLVAQNIFQSKQTFLLYRINNEPGA